MHEYLGRLKKRLQGMTLSPLHLVLTTYLLLLFSRLLGNRLFSGENAYLTTVVLQILIFLVPAALYGKLRGEGFSQTLKLGRPALSHLLITLCAALMLIGAGTLLGLLLGGQSGNSFTLYDTFTSQGDGNITTALYRILAYAILPALCEELVFRAILCAEYEKHGAPTAILVSSLFFALLHFNLRHLPIYLVAGLVLALLFYATKTIVAPIIAHVLYNVFGLFGMPAANAFYRITGDVGFFLFLVGAVLLLACALFAGEAAKLYRHYAIKHNGMPTPRPSAKAVKQTLAAALLNPTAMICYLLYIIAAVINLLRL